MASEFQLPVRDWQYLAWTLLLMNAIRRSGFEEIDSAKFHRLQFFSNSLAPIYGEQPPVELVMKLDRGPFFPDAQHDIDTLCICGLTTISDIKWHNKSDRVWKTANYGLTSAGFGLCKTLSAESLWCGDVAVFMHDLVMAYSDLSDEALDGVALKDLTYAQKGMSVGDIIPYKGDRNLSVRGTGAMAAMLPAAFEPNRWNQLRMYLKYLEQLAA